MTEPAYLLDTDVICETAKPKPHPGVLHWLSRQKRVYLSAVSIYEIDRRILALPTGRRRAFLESWFSRILAGSIELVGFDVQAALAAASMAIESNRRGGPTDVRDLFILASAKVNGHRVATRNVPHFRGHGVLIYDPFTDTHGH